MADVENPRNGPPYRSDEDEALLASAAEALQRAENLLANIERGKILDKLDEIKEIIESVPQVQLDLRIARIRITASLRDDPDKTPIPKHLSATMRAVDPPKGSR